MASIARATAACLSGFGELRQELRDPEHLMSMPPEKLELEHGRFKIWSGNLGALQSGRSSLDFRLRESTVMRTTILTLLTKMSQTLIKSTQVVTGTRLPLEKHPKPDNLSDISDDEDESDEAVDDDEMPTELELNLQAIVETLADLYKLSFRIRNTATRPKTLKSTHYKEVDKETGCDKFEMYAKFDKRHVEESFLQLRKEIALKKLDELPGMDKDRAITEFSKITESERPLVEKLAATITRRRRAIRYWQHHSKKLAEIAIGDKEEVQLHFSLDHLAQSEAKQEAPNAQDNSALVPSVTEKTLLSKTEATRFDKSLDDMIDTQSVISYSSTSFDPHENSIDFPPPPRAASTRAEFFCPYCGIICPARYGQDRAWKTHFIHDLQPYICTYPNCADDLQLYSDRTSWLEHERLVHRRVWQCFEHVAPKFGNPEGLRKHLETVHQGNVTASQIESLLEVSESSVEDTRDKCPVCLSDGPFLKGLHRHMSYHLEAFAMFSVNKGIAPEDDDNEALTDEQSGRAQALGSEHSTHSDSLTFKSQPRSEIGSVILESRLNADENNPLSVETETEWTPVLESHLPENTLRLATEGLNTYKPKAALSSAQTHILVGRNDRDYVIQYRRLLTEKRRSAGRLLNVPCIESPPADDKSKRFRNTLHALSSRPLQWENPGLLDEALQYVPLEQIYTEAEEESLIYQAEAESLEGQLVEQQEDQAVEEQGKDLQGSVIPSHAVGKRSTQKVTARPSWGYQDCVVRALQKWFKGSFFSWVNSPLCSQCTSPTIAVGLTPPTDDERAHSASSVELFQCSSSDCKAFERFPRYSDPFVLMQTRRGRVGEWVLCFGMLCRALGTRMRWVWNSEDHLWNECYSSHHKRWVSLDPCEGTFDQPLLYTEGWGRKLGYCIAYSCDGVTDVTRRYVRNFDRWGGERSRCSEATLEWIVQEIRSTRRKDMSEVDRFRLRGEDRLEDRELSFYFAQSLTAELCRWFEVFQAGQQNPAQERNPAQDKTLARGKDPS